MADSASNGSSPAAGDVPDGLRPAPALVIADLFARKLAEFLGSWIAQQPQMLASVLAQTKLKQPMCAQCLLQRLLWEARYDTELDAALATAITENGIAERADPRVGSLDLAAYLPEPLRPHPSKPWDGDRMPQILDGVTFASGSWCCPFHIPGAPPPDGVTPLAAVLNQRPPLIAMPGISLSAAAAIAMGNVPGLPGAPGQ